MEIRNAKKTDFKNILILVEKMVAYHRELDGYYKPFSKYQNLKVEAESWLKDKNTLVLVTEDESGLIGYGRFSVEKAPTYVSAKKIGVVDDIFIEPSYRKHGVAKEIFNQALEWFKKKKVTNVELNVDARNTAGIEFWKKLGFFGYKMRMRIDL